MKTKMEQLQADMMTKGVFTRHERRQMKYLTKANEAQHQYVKAALPAKHQARRWMETCGNVDSWGNVDYCGVPLCPRCHMRERTVQTGKAIKKIFCEADNDDLAFATILLPTQPDFSRMTDLLEKEKRRLRTFIDRQRSLDCRWDDFQLLGWWEIDRMSFGDFESCGRNTRIALDAMGFPLMESPTKTIWRPHLHAIIRKGRLTTEEIGGALRKQTHTAKYQVDIQPFRAYRDSKDNIQSIVRYCLKFRIESDYKSPGAQEFVGCEQAETDQRTERNWWPAEDVRQYVDWLCLERSGFQSLRVFIGQAKVDVAAKGQVAGCLNQSVANESISGVSRVSPSDRSTAHPTEMDKRSMDGAITSNINRNSNVDATSIFSTETIGTIYRKSELTHCLYNNIVQDTNWTDVDVGSLLPGNGRQSVMATNRMPGHIGNVVSLSDRVRSIIASKRASNDLSVARP